jgi:hypothetical protein
VSTLVHSLPRTLFGFRSFAGSSYGRRPSREDGIFTTMREGAKRVVSKGLDSAWSSSTCEVVGVRISSTGALCWGGGEGRAISDGAVVGGLTIGAVFLAPLDADSSWSQKPSAAMSLQGFLGGVVCVSKLRSILAGIGTRVRTSNLAVAV